MDRRPDRLEQWESRALLALGENNWTRFSAIDGSSLRKSRDLQIIFDNNDYRMRRGMVGCAMSHIKLYSDFVNSQGVNDIWCILEDDIEFVPNFLSKLRSVLRDLEDKKWDLVYLGHHIRPQFQTPRTRSTLHVPKLEKWNTHKSLTQSLGGTGGYLINKSGSLNLLEFIRSGGMTNGIDTVQQKAADTLNIFYLDVHLIWAECFPHQTNLDTDIQNDHISLEATLDKRLQWELDLYPLLKEVSEPPPGGTQPDFFYMRGNSRKELEERARAGGVQSYYFLGDQIIIVGPKLDRLNKSGKWNLDNILG